MVFSYFKVFYAMRQQSTKVAAGLKNGENGTQITTVETREHEHPAKDTNEQEGVYHVADPPGSSVSNQQYLSTGSSYYSNVKMSNDSDHNSPAGIESSKYDTRSLTRSQQGRQKLLQSQNRERKIFVTLTYVLSSYLICWFPFYIAFDTSAWKPELVPAELYTFFFWMTYVNSTLNPFIYAYTSKEFRSAFMKVLRSLYRCKI